jgi:hypothetical protein
LSVFAALCIVSVLGQGAQRCGFHPSHHHSVVVCHSAVKQCTRHATACVIEHAEETSDRRNASSHDVAEVKLQN